MKTHFLIILMLMVIQTIAQASVVTLTNGALEVGVAPDLGGRVVFIRKSGTEGMILSDRRIWKDPSFVAPEVKDVPEFYPFNGITLWVGPQSGWWKDQSYSPELKAKNPGWPPDPFAEQGRFKIVKQTKDYIEMIGPESPVTGLQLYKTVQILPDGKVKLGFTATNIRTKPVWWDLWVNIRSTPHATASVKVKSPDDVRIASSPSDERDALITEYKEGVFSILPVMPTEGKKARGGKVFIDPETSEIVATYKDMRMTIRFDKVSKELMHPEQAPVELYSHLSAVPDPALELLELEFHGPYSAFPPGGSKTIECTIELE